MEEGNQRSGRIIKKDRDEVFSKVARAGKRTYFFDVKMSRSSDLYITLTESMKRSTPNGRFFYEKHKIFLYREDFEIFVDGLSAILEYVESQPENKAVIKSHKSKPLAETISEDFYEEIESYVPETFSSLDFNDLGNK